MKTTICTLLALIVMVKINFAQTISLSVTTSDAYTIPKPMMGTMGNLFPQMASPAGFPCAKCEKTYNNCNSQTCSNGTPCPTTAKRTGLDVAFIDSVVPLTFQSLYFPEGVHCKYSHYIHGYHGFCIDPDEAAALDVWSGDHSHMQEYCNENNYQYGNFFELAIDLCQQTGMHIVISTNPYFGSWAELKSMLVYATGAGVQVDAIVFGTELQTDLLKTSQTVNGVTIPFTDAYDYFDHIKAVYFDNMELDNDYMNSSYAGIPIYFSVAGKQPNRAVCDVRTYTRGDQNQKENKWNWQLHEAIDGYTGGVNLGFNGSVNYWWYPIASTTGYNTIDVDDIRQDFHDFLNGNTGVFETAYYDPKNLNNGTCTGFTNLLADQWGIKRVDQNDDQSTTCEDTFENTFLDQAFIIERLLYLLDHNQVTQSSQANAVMYDAAYFYGLSSGTDYNPISGNADGWTTSITANDAFKELNTSILNSTVKRAGITFSSNQTDFMDAFYAFGGNNRKLILVNYSDLSYTLNGLSIDGNGFSGTITYFKAAVTSGGTLLSERDDITRQENLTGNVSSLSIPALSILIFDLCSNLSVSISAGGVTTFCQGGSVTLNATSSAAISYQWNKDGISIASATNSSYTASSTGNYTCTVMSAFGCIVTSSAILVTVNSNPGSTPSSNSPVCAGATLNLTGSPSGFSYSWSGPNSFSSTSQSPSISSATTAATGTYTLTVTNTSTGCSSIATTAATVNANPGSTPSSNSPVCAGATLNLTGSPSGYSYNWSGPNSFSSTSQNPSISSVTSAAGGTYTLTVTNSSTGCSSTATTAATVNVNPGSTPSSNSPVCAGATLNLTGSPSGFSYSWSGPNSFSSTSQSPSISSATTAATGTYTLTVTNTSTGCTSIATTAATVNANPGSSPSSNSPVCQGASLNFTGSPSGYSYSWSGPSSFSSTQQNPAISPVPQTAAGTYTLTVTNSSTGCTSTGTTSVTVNSKPGSSPSSNSPVCAGATLNLTGSPSGYSYVWSGPNSYTSTQQSPSITSVTTAAAGTYGLKVINNSTGCFSTNTTSVVINVLPGSTPSNNSPICAGNTLNLTGGPSGYSYSWSGPNSFSSTQQSPSITGATTAATGTYTLTVTNTSTGCFSTATTASTVNANPGSTPSNNSPVCAGATLNLTGSPSGYSYSWSGPNSFSSTSQSPSITSVTTAAGGTYTLTVTNTSTGCLSTSTTAATINSNPGSSPSNSGPVCEGSTLNFTGSPSGYSYSWSGPNSFSSSQQSPSITSATTAATGTYTLTVTNTSTACSSTATTAATVNQNPSATITPSPTATYCPVTGGYVTLTAGTSSAYQWKQNGTDISGANNSTYNAGSTDNYAVRVTGSNGCTATSSSVSVSQGDCPMASGLTVVSCTTTSANLSWTSVSCTPGPLNYTLKYRITGSNAAWTSVTVNGTSTTLSGLQSNTNYSWRVITNCTASVSSDNVNGTQFKTTATCTKQYAIDPSESLLIYPNPASDQIVVSLPYDPQVTFFIELLDVQGRVLKQLNSSAKETMLDVSALASGLYLLKVQSPEITAMRLKNVSTFQVVR